MNNYTFKEAEYLVRFYFDVRDRQKKQKDTREGEEETLGEIMDYAMARLDEEGRRILHNEFELNYPKQWWQDYYSKSSYYAIKGRAMRSFLAKMHR